MKVLTARKPSEKILEKLHSLEGKKGLIAVIEPESGDYFIGKTLTETLKRAKTSYPGKLFYSIRIGSPFLFEHKGGIKRV